MNGLGVERYQKNIRDAKLKGRESVTLYGVTLMKEAISAGMPSTLGHDFFEDMGSAYGAIGFLDPTEKAEFAEAICDFMDKKVAI